MCTNRVKGKSKMSINIFKEEGIVEHSRMLGTDVIGPELEKLKAKFRHDK